MKSSEDESEVMNKKNYNLPVVIITLAILILGTVGLVSLINDKPVNCEHKYSGYKETVSPSTFAIGEKQKKCWKCKEIISERINATVDLPQLYLDGDIDLISKTSDCMVKADYFDDDVFVDAYATIKYQGHTSLGFEKKNFTIKFYEIESREKKYKFSLNGWDETHKYCLKANYIDFSSARNVVSSNVWSDVVASRKNLDKNIAELDFYGGIDGYPVALFINNEYQGIYTFNIPKDEDTFNIADEENEAMFIINTGSTAAANFKALITEEEKDFDFELEYSYPEDADWPYESLNNLISFVMNNDDEAFKNGIENYLDVDAAIDYLVTAYALGVTDNFAKNMILLTYDGQKWIPNMYDLDTACGLAFDGTEYYDYDFALPYVTEDGTISSGTDNLLWDRILNNYTEEFKERFCELRKNILSTENLIKRYYDFMVLIPDECYAYEVELYPHIPFNNVNQTEQISTFIKSRCGLLDSIIANM